MANILSGLESGIKGFVAGWQLEQEGKKLKLAEEQQKSATNLAEAQKIIDYIKVQTEAKKQDIELEKLHLEQIKIIPEIASAQLEGREDITPKEKDNWVKIFKEKANIDVEPFFNAMKDDKGFVKGYSFSGESITEQLERQAKDLDLKSKKADLLTKELDRQLKEVEIAEAKNPLDVFDNWRKKNPNATWEENIARLTEYSVAKQPAGKIIDITSPDGTRIRIGPIEKPIEPVSSGEKLEIEKNLNSMTKELSMLNNIKSKYFKEITTYEGKLKNFALTVLDKSSTLQKMFGKLDAEDKEFLGKSWDLKASFGKYFDEYRLRVTKSQAAMRELNMLRQNVLNSTMGSSALEYNINRAVDEIKRQMRIQRFILSKGFEGQEFWNKFDELVAAKREGKLDFTTGVEERTRRGLEIENSIKDRKFNSDIERKRFIVEKLREEGYLQ